MSDNETKQYAERDIIEIDRAGGHYVRHVSAMTREDLHDKSAIAAELAYRDMRIADIDTGRFGITQRLGQCRQLLSGELWRKRIGDEGLDRFTGDGCGEVTACWLQIHSK